MTANTKNSATVDLSIKQIVANPNQPRQVWDSPDARQDMANLVKSIKENGLLQPIVVRPLEDGTFMIVCGERRFRAHKVLKLPTISAIVRDMTEDEMALAAITENLQRADIEPLDEGRAFRAMLDKGWTPMRLGKALGVDHKYITNRALLLDLSEEHQALVRSGLLNVAAAAKVAMLPTEALRQKIVREIATGKLRTYADVKARVLAVLAALKQTTMEGTEPKDKSEADKEAKAVDKVESLIQRITDMVAKGFDKNALTIAKKVDPTKCAKLASLLKLTRDHLQRMERELDKVAAAADVDLPADSPSAPTAPKMKATRRKASADSILSLAS